MKKHRQSKTTSRNFFRYVFTAALVFCFVIGMNTFSFPQSKPQRPDTPKGNQKKNQRSEPKTEDQRKREEEERNAVIEDDPVKIETAVVNVDTVVYNKKSGQIITGLKKENFAIFENGVKKEISNFSTPDAPITITVVVDFSRRAAQLGYLGQRGYESGKFEMIRPVAYFLTKFIRPPDDYASVIAYDMRPTPLTDFTNDPKRLNEVINLLARNSPAFTDSNMFDAIKLTLVGGKADSVVLENSKQEKMDYAGMVSLKAKRRAVLLVATGLDSMSRINYGEVRKIIQQAGIPIYVIGTGEMFMKLYEDRIDAVDTISGFPGRLTLLQARNTLQTFANESGGVYYPVTFESELPATLSNINTLLRNQYSLAYEIEEARPRDGKKYKIEVKVDQDGDGVYEEKTLVIQHRPFYFAPKEGQKDGKN